MIERSALDWRHVSGRNSEGEKFNVDALIHGSGRVLAKVFGPAGNEEFIYRTTFYFTVSKKILPNENEAFDFVDLDSAKRFAELIVTQSSPAGLPGFKVPAGSKSPAKRKKVTA